MTQGYSFSIAVQVSGKLSFLCVQVLVLLLTLVLVLVGTWGSLLIRQEFDPVLFLPAGSYMRDFVELHERQFPKDG